MFPKIFVFLAVIQCYVIEYAYGSVCNGMEKHKNFHLLPTGEECRPVFSSPKVQGGRDVELGEFPWLVVLFLGLEMLDVEMKWCTGSIITDKFIITAAHCMPEDIVQVYDVVVRVGEHDLRTELDCDGTGTDCAPPPVTYKVDKFIPHPEYNTNDNNNDIGLVRIKGEIQWNGYVYPACLPFTCSLMKTNFAGKKLVLSGFGALIDSPETIQSNVLQKVTLTGVNRDSCAQSYSKPIDPSQICVGGSGTGEMNKDACHGDSGGPLIYRSREGGLTTYPYLVGLVSSGENCTLVKRTQQVPGIYTRVATYLPWILDNIHE